MCNSLIVMMLALRSSVRVTFDSLPTTTVMCKALQATEVDEGTWMLGKPLVCRKMRDFSAAILERG
jgi:hypothetical protein